MYKKFISAFYLLNILFQALYSLALPIGIGALAAFLLTEFAFLPSSIWVIALLIGVFIGLYSMVKFILTAMNSLDRLEREQAERTAENLAKEKRQAELRKKTNNNESDGENNE